MGSFELTLTHYSGDGESVVVPEGVTVIAHRAFANNDAVRDVVLPEGVVEVASQAFASCVHLQRVSLPESLEMMLRFAGAATCANCVFPKGLQRFPSRCFSAASIWGKSSCPRGLR